VAVDQLADDVGVPGVPGRTQVISARVTCF
jgi:hypothetical protein